MQAYWSAVTELCHVNPAFHLTFLQAFAFVRHAYRKALRATQQQAAAPAAADASSEGDSLTGEGSDTRVGMTPAERAAALCLVTKAAALEQHMAVFPSKMIVSSEAFHAALLETAASWLDKPACLLFGAMMRMHLGEVQGSVTHSQRRAFLRLLVRQEPCIAGGACSQPDPEAAPSDACTNNAQPAGCAIASETVWLDNVRLDNLAWLEVELPSLSGVVQHVKDDTRAWYATAAGEAPWAALPARFADAPALDRLMLVIVLDAAHLQSALLWYECQAPTAFEEQGRIARALGAVHMAACVALLHAQDETDPIEAVQLLASMQASGMAVAHVADDTAINLMSPRSGTAPKEVPTPPVLVALHLHRHLRSSAVKSALDKHAPQHVWVLLASAHLRPDLVVHALQTFAAIQRSGTAHPDFRLFLYCPTAELHSVPLRAQMQVIALGETHAIAPHVLQMCNVADLPAAAHLHLAESAGDADLSRQQQAAVQQMGLCIFLTFATANTLAQQWFAPLALGLSDLCHTSRLVHCVQIARHFVKRAPAGARIDFAQLRLAVAEVRF
jgi:hypothetical protein